MGNFCCDEQRDTVRSQLPEQKLKVIDNPKANNIEPSTILKPDDFQSRRYLGKGSFGSVVLVKRKNIKTDKVYAMKIIDKKQIKEKNLLQTDYIEKVICTSNNPFLVRILNTFQNEHKIYIVMEYVDGGDLYYYLAHEKFSEDLIRKLIPEILEAISFLHVNDIIYRDLKPENVLVTADGHIQITDFGFSCLNPDNQPLYTFAGILEYMAPEVIEKKGYDKMVDLWGLGILMYELRHGVTPFRGEDSEITKHNIIQNICEMDSDCSEEFCNLVYGLLVKDPRCRMSINTVRQHPFFKGTDWVAVRSRDNQAPMKEIKERINIRYKGPEDTSDRTFTSVCRSLNSYRVALHEFTNREDRDTQSSSR